MEELFNAQDLEQLEHLGISPEEAKRQVADIRSGFPHLDIQAPATLEHGIVRIEKENEPIYMEAWASYLNSPQANVCKMIPASGAASRMFKGLFAYLEQEQGEMIPQVEHFFANLAHFAFYDRLGEACLRNNWKTISKLLNTGGHKLIIENLLDKRGLSYGTLPKGLIQFHSSTKGSNTAAEEHLAEGAMYARLLDGKVRLHFTVSPEHRKAFELIISENKAYFEDKYSVVYDISYSEQKASTDTIALSPDGSLFRHGEEQQLLFRPGGHGALIHNLNELDADIVFIKNIDNVVPEYRNSSTIINKRLLAGVLIVVREQIYKYLQLLNSEEKVSHSILREILAFVQDNLCQQAPEDVQQEDQLLHSWLQAHLDRPLRVCGMVRNTGEPGGGPFIIRESDGSTSLQILESSQINMQDDEQRTHFEAGGYFNPVDLVCSLRNHEGKAYDLLNYINHKTAFIAQKSLNGQDLLALERPGLWNGAMHHWNTIFVEVPIETFNPVKEVNDLLRPEHQP